MGPWGDYIFPSLLLGDKQASYTVAIGLKWLTDQQRIETYYTQFAAGAVLVSVPIVILFSMLQRYYEDVVHGDHGHEAGEHADDHHGLHQQGAALEALAAEDEGGDQHDERVQDAAFVGLYYAMAATKLSVGYIVLALMTVIWLFPILWIVLTSFRGESGYYVGYFIPKTFTLDNYLNLFKEDGPLPFARWWLNTLHQEASREQAAGIDEHLGSEQLNGDGCRFQRAEGGPEARTWLPGSTS